jgi:hypothetical protein
VCVCVCVCVCVFTVAEVEKNDNRTRAGKALRAIPIITTETRNQTETVEAVT